MPQPFQPAGAGVDVRAYRTPTLPPATHTNTSFVGRRDVWIVDPATPYDAERAALLEDVRALQRAGREAKGIVLTHHHRDHVGGAGWLAAETGLPILAHPVTRDLLAKALPVDRLLDEGDVLTGSDHADDAWHVLFTPGHAPGHIVLWEPVRRLLIGGDMVAGIGTILVAPPDGHMATYLAQLERLRALTPARLVPAHGPLLDDPGAVLAHYIAHRLAREARVLGALESAPADLTTVTARSYPDVPKAILGLAAGSALAHLIKLQEEGRAARHPTPSGDRWSTP